MWSWRAQIISLSSCQLLQAFTTVSGTVLIPIESIWFWEPTESCINRMFSTSPAQAGETHLENA